ncbi:MAG: thiolase family protein [Planctomycetes bacterium]|nr:thiolase family protein [Planctomycetota bacterium]
MSFHRAYIPYGCGWSTPFVKWQGSMANLHPLKFAAQCAMSALRRAKVDAGSLDGMVLGWTVPSTQSFYGAPWVAALLGAPGIGGPTVMQACATGARAIATAASMLDAGSNARVLVLTADRCSNGPHLYYPDSAAPGGTGQAENWVMDNFGKDPWAGGAMIATAENVAKEAGIDRAAQDAMTLLRYAQYEEALKDDAAFLRRFMLLPLEINPSGKKVLATVRGDEGVFATTAEGLAGLRPVLPEGTVTFGSQTHPADGNAGLLVTGVDEARELATDKAVTIRIVSSGEARVKKGFMAMATVPAAGKALAAAGWSFADCNAIKTHNPFAVNDVYFSRETGVPAEQVNRFGSSLIFGHPQGPTGTRLVLELIEELVLRGGGRGLFVGCAAGDCAMALCVEVRVA